MMEKQQYRQNKAGQQSNYKDKPKYQKGPSKFKKIQKKGNQGQPSSFVKKQSHHKSANHKVDQTNSSHSTPHQSNSSTTPTSKPKGNQQLPTIQTMLEIPKDKRQSKTTEYFKKVRPFLQSFMQKKIGSRVVQLMFKWGNKQVKQQIHKVIVTSWKDLIKSKYALHSIATVSGEYEFPRIIQDSILLQNNKQGSMLLQDHIVKHPSSYPQIIQKLTSIQSQHKQKGLQSQQQLHNLAIKSLQKQYYTNKISKHIIRLALPTMVEQQRQKVIQFFSSTQQVLQLFNDEEGVKLFVLLYNYFESKVKKTIVKMFDGKVAEIVRLCKISYVGLIKVICDTDDTVVVGNKIIPELLQLLVQPTPATEMEDQNQNKGQVQEVSNNQPNNHRLLNIIVSLLSPRTNNLNCLGKIEKTVEYTTCKKPEQSRKQQIRAFMYPTLTQYITKEQNMEKMITDLHLSKLPFGVLKSMQADSSEYLKDYATKLLKYFLADLQKYKVSGSKKIKISQTLTSHNFGSKLLKNVLLLQQPYIDKYCDKFAEIFKHNLEDTLRCNASFVLTALIEKGRNQLMQQIKRAKIDVSKAKAADFYLGRLKAKSGK